MIEIRDETLLTLADAAKRLPRRRAGRKTHVSSLYRWATSGFRGIRLEVVRVGSTLCTSEEALQRFVERMTAEDEALATTSITPPSNAAHATDQDAVEEQLDGLGV